MPKKEKERKSIYLFVVLLGVFFANPLGEILGVPHVFLDCTIFGVLVGGVFAVSRRPRTLWIGLILALPSVILHSMSLVDRSAGFQIAAQVFDILFCVFLSVVLFKYLFSGRKVTSDKIFAAISIYMIIGMLFGFIHRLIEITWPGSYAFASHLGSFDMGGELLYFSFATLTTLGYGDISPIHPLARTVSMVEAIAGVTFLATFLARLVGLHTTEGSE